ncbi:VOC family protein [Candidatus Parcubacteria bacterium]|nr:VOC family protein [Candidatus Parcubacteria bacterium]
MKNRVVHFEIQAEDPERAATFYKNIFGWSIDAWPGMKDYWVIMTAEKDSKEPGINGGLLRRPAKTPPPQFGTNAYVCTVQVDNYDEIEKKILAGGGIVAMSKFSLGGMAWQGYYLDTEGNTFGLHQAI